VDAFARVAGVVLEDRGDRAIEVDDAGSVAPAVVVEHESVVSDQLELGVGVD
jgi:hypothetical protein